jgi:MarR family transcriptional regulator, transcriptional regulator for hemolysin
MRKRHSGVAALATNTNQVYGEHSRRLEFLLYGVARLLRRHFDSKARGLRLSRIQCQALVYLHRNEGVNQTCLAQLLDVKAITVVRLIDKLQSMGLAERHTDPSDRRVWRLNLTPAARAKVAEARELGDLTRSEALAGLASAEIEQLVKTLQVVKANLLNAYNSPAIEGERGAHTRLNGAPKQLPRRPRVGSTPGATSHSIGTALGFQNQVFDAGFKASAGIR